MAALGALARPVREAKRHFARTVERVTGLPLRWQIGTLVLLGLTGILALFGILGLAIAEDGKQRTIAQWFAITTSTASYIDSEIEAEFQRLEALATLVAAEADDPRRQRETLDDSFGQRESFVGGVYLLDARGAIVWSRPTGLVARPEELTAGPRVLEPLRTGTRYASGIARVGGAPAAFLSVPVRGPDGHPSAVIAAMVVPDRGAIGELVASARRLAQTGHAELVDQNDIVMASSEEHHVMGSGEHPDFYEPLLAEHRSAVGLTAPVTSTDPADSGQRHEMAFVPLRTVPWALALGSWDAELSAGANRWQQQIVLFGALSLGLALLMVWLTTRSVAHPILALAAASRQIAAGDLATSIPLEGEGEVRVLAQAFDQMRRELQRVLSALALEESRYEGIVTSMADAVVTTDPALRITAFNPSAAALTGWSTDDALGRSCCEVVCARGAGPDQCEEACSLRTADPDRGVSKETLRRRDGSEIPVAVTRAPIRDTSGGLAGTVHVLRDISAEAEVARLKDEFLSTVSHELRTPLGVIMGYATTLLLPDAPEDKRVARRCLEVIAQSSNELKELVDNLLDMTRIGAGALSVLPAPTQLGPLVRAAVERIQVRADGHRLATAIPPSLPLVAVDAHRLEQVLYNLLDNAIKYSPHGGRVAVRAALGRGEVVVSVLDDGLGIPTDEHAALFERFYRGRIARSSGIPGSGLGLAICKGIVEAHGGRIWVESPPGDGLGARQGTAIRFTVPLASVALN